MKNATVWAAACLLALVAGAGWAEESSVKAAHENLEAGERTDDLGITVPIPASHPGRRYPASHDFPSGPEVGEAVSSLVPGRYIWIAENEDQAIRAFPHGSLAYSTAAAAIVPNASRQFWRNGVSC